MISLFKNEQINEILSYISEDYPKCLYLYLDLVKYGCHSDTTITWMQTKDGRITAVMLAYHTALHIYSKEMDFDAKELSDFVIKQNPSIICASAELIKILEPYLTSKGFISEFGHIGKYIQNESSSTSYDIRLATKDDIKEIAKLLYEDDDIGSSYTMEDLVKQMEERMDGGFVRSYVIKQDNHVVAHLATGAEIPKLCTVCYGITDSNYRGRGYFKNLMVYLCSELGKEGKEIYSVYYMENARKQHHKVGFVDCCDFGKLYRNIQ